MGCNNFHTMFCLMSTIQRLTKEYIIFILFGPTYSRHKIDGNMLAKVYVVLLVQSSPVYPLLHIQSTPRRGLGTHSAVLGQLDPISHVIAEIIEWDK